MSQPLADGQVYLGPLQTIETVNSIAQRQFASDRRERNMKTYQISEDRLVVVKKNLVTIEFTPSRLVLHTFVTKYCTSLVVLNSVNLQRFIFHFFSLFLSLFAC